jgi:predicted phage tail protein
MNILRTIRLYGKLGVQFGRIHRLAVESTAEAVRALCVMLPGFQTELMTSNDRGIAYACFVGKTNISKDDLQLAGGGDIRIAPVLAGAKSGGFLQVVLGVALIAASFYAPGLSLKFASVLFGMGTSMALGGVVQILSPQQSQSSSADKVENGASYNFNGPVNTTAQGNPVPVLYGRMLVGSAVISAGILAQDQAYVGATVAPMTPQKALDIFMAAL